MIGLDTNVLVRHLVQDDPRQAAAASRQIAELTPSNPGFVDDVVLVESYRVLRHTYGLAHKPIVDVLGQLVTADNIAVRDPQAVRKAHGLAERGADFADAMILSAAWRAGCDDFVTFDRKAARVFAQITAD